ncbi:hypothetical protein HU200_039728 [Digitaria exilis]|uniref:Uncharacterized protein n=1 Tax=Digitaria exilis TaxID=1010633 RepID=A0A835EHZ8_9POAL|nr:hypothetical protein HU200_039728 [Digitaria exilis]
MACSRTGQQASSSATTSRPWSWSCCPRRRCSSTPSARK